MGAAMSEYRKKAEECLRAAERMRDPADRIEMLFIARGYISLADHADRTRIESPQQRTATHFGICCGRTLSRPLQTKEG